VDQWNACGVYSRSSTPRPGAKLLANSGFIQGEQGLVVQAA
jgi:hypothetical protein